MNLLCKSNGVWRHETHYLQRTIKEMNLLYKHISWVTYHESWADLNKRILQYETTYNQWLVQGICVDIRSMRFFNYGKSLPCSDHKFNYKWYIADWLIVKWRGIQLYISWKCLSYIYNVTISAKLSCATFFIIRWIITLHMLFCCYFLLGTRH